VSRPAIVPPPASALTLDSIWKIADSPLPSDSLPRRPNRDESDDNRARQLSSPSVVRPRTYSTSRLMRP